MSDNQKDVVIAAYLFEDLAKKDFDAMLKLARTRRSRSRGSSWSRRMPTARCR
jgi:hypothetical protein